MTNSFANLWTITHKAPLSVGFPRQEYWNELPLPSSRDFSNPGNEPVSPALADKFLLLSHQVSPVLKSIHTVDS